MQSAQCFCLRSKRRARVLTCRPGKLRSRKNITRVNRQILQSCTKGFGLILASAADVHTAVVREQRIRLGGINGVIPCSRPVIAVSAALERPALAGQRSSEYYHVAQSRRQQASFQSSSLMFTCSFRDEKNNVSRNPKENTMENLSTTERVRRNRIIEHLLKC